MTPRKKRLQKPKTYEQLRTVWYKKLAKAGFEDVEYDETRIKDGSSKFRRSVAILNWESKNEYYYLAAQFLNDYKFESHLERIVWEYHSNGLSKMDIVNTINKTKTVHMYRTKVYRILKRLIEEMKRMYLIGYKPNE